MSNFLPPTTVEKTLAAIQQRRYVLPAIQREFVWDADQICQLFDSLMRGYPIGSFLFWAVKAEQAQDFTFYEFLTDYHELRNPYAPIAHIPAGQDVTAVLDGQQRLTALNIGLYGSLAERLPRKWANNPEAYPVKRLHLNITRGGDGEGLATRFLFRFLTDAEAAPNAESDDLWFKVADVLKFKKDSLDILDWLSEKNVVHNRDAHVRLNTLYRAIRERDSMNAYEEDDQDPNTVLDIFVRVNSGGTQLSYSDLLLSMATNQWSELDARQEVRDLVEDLNGSAREMSFNRDNVLKTALVLIDVSDVRFNVSNFTSSNMAELEKQWTGVRSAMLLAARLLMSFGFTSRTLTANSVIIPLAYYLYRRNATDSYLTSNADRPDREKIRTWVLRSLVKRGIWGSGLDTLLIRLREAIRSAPADSGWPSDRLEAVMAPLGKSLSFTPAEISELAQLQYNSARTFAVLALLYPGLNLAHQFHEDHIFPRARFSAAKLRKFGIPEDQHSAYRAAVNGLPNLQLLAGPVNIAKKDSWPWEWLASGAFASEAARAQYRAQNDLDLLPDSFDGFLEFNAARQERLEHRLRKLLGVEEREDDAAS
ncbi:DUF262 domain-containing protein [Pseudonocardia sp. RS11V-5]|uniref:DUF262 domain-containing protein n=1 Tax=Pseudonocardia terrae TaxID=2905831 RepID=UPI001E564717|nr:DUF262 domain-containing protein [Pseudonocardia terrae]MCE3554513.1 DUF262 domain-containing protein [Pseudonocardia terrae]